MIYDSITSLNIIFVLIMSLIVPYLLGRLVRRICGDECEMISKDLSYGFMLMCVLFLVTAVPMILLRISFHILVWVWTGEAAVACAIELFLTIRKKEFENALTSISCFLKDVRSDRYITCIWVSAILIISFETALLTFKMHVDTDDARFIADAMEAVENDTMLLHHPITGQYFGIATGEQRKDITAPYPLFIGLFGKVTGIHPAICAHTVFPFLYIILSYMVFALAGDHLFKGDIKRRGLFLLFLSLINLFSFETIYAAGYTLLTIIWQGRSVAAMIMLPLFWYILIKNTDKDDVSAGDYILMSLASLANAMLSNMSALFALIMCLAYMAVMTIRKRSFKIPVYTLISMIPVMAVIVIGRIFSGTDILYRSPEVVKII